MPQVTMPDGALVDMPDQLDPEMGARLRAFHDETLAKGMANNVPGSPEETASTAAQERIRAAHPAPERSWMDDVGDFRVLPDLDLRGLWTAIKGAPETGLAMANNAIAAGTAGITAPFVAQNPDDAADYVRDFTASNSYSPQGESAQKLTSAVGDAFAPYERGKQALGDSIMEHTGSPALATGGQVLPDLVAMLAGGEQTPGNYAAVDSRLGPASITAKSKAAPTDLSNVGDMLSYHNEMAPPLQKTPRVNPDDPVAFARGAGIKVLPSDVERITQKKPGFMDRAAESLAPEDVRRDMTIDNQRAANQLQREKLGTPEGVRNNRRGIEKQKQPHFDTYEEVNDAINVVPPSEDYLFALDEATQRAGFPAGAKPKVTEVISALRTKARRKINNPAADDKLEAEGRLADQAADKLEEAMGTELKNTGQEELLGKYQAARQSLGELNDAAKTQRGGNVDPQKVKKLDEKNPNKMTGQTKMLADIADDFPDLRSSMTGAGKKAGGGSFAPEKATLTSAAAKLGKKAVRGVAKMIPPLGDRLLVESEGFQNRLGKAATPEERSYFADYGKKPAKGELVSSPGAVDPKKGLDFSETAGVTPSKAVTLSDRLGLEPEPVANPDALPETPDRLTADAVPRSRGDVEPKFDAQAEADKMAGDLGIDVRTGTKGAIGEKELSDLLADQGSGDLKTAPPREMEQLDFTPQVKGETPNRLQLTNSPKGAGKITAARDKSGNVTVRHEDGGEITAIELPEQGTMQIKDSKVPAESRGRGRGQAMARQLAAMAKKRGLRLVSDNRVSESAQAMWKALKAKGLKVRQNPATRQASGELVSKSDLKPVFEIIDDAVTE